MSASKLGKNFNHNYLTQRFGENFCASPWNSLHEGPDGVVTTCCKTRSPIGNSKTQSFEEMYNSDHAMSVRKEFLEGKKPAQCKECWVQEESGNASLNRISGNNMSSLENIANLVKKTDKKTGYMPTHKPEWLDLLWSNKCNFACLGCVPDLSSTINKNFKEEFAILNGKDPNRYYNNFADWSNGNSAKIDYILKHKDTLTRIHFNGGEPFLNEDIYELLDVLLKKNLHKKIKIWTHTNGSVTKSYKGIDIINDYLVHWGSNASITLSSDGNGKIGEYIRWGYNDKKWLSTYRKIKEAEIKLKIQTCYNVFNACDIDHIGQWYIDNCSISGSPYGSLTVWTNETTNPSMLNYNLDVRQTAINSLKNLLQSKNHPLGWEENLNKWLDWLTGTGKAMQHQKNYSSDNYSNLKSWYNGVNALDIKRGTNLCKDISKLAPLYELGKKISN
jgi:MoaA/NifB/PqqE/SkfB family radical SAM enzyme